jgi:hypothetical protein
MFTPPFCPNPHCEQHSEEVHPPGWYIRYGYHKTQAFGRVQRYKCLSCGQTFSSQTFAMDYYAKKIIDYEQIFRQIRSTAGIRDLSRNLEISRGSVENRLFRMAHWAIAAHSLARHSLHLHEDLVADGFEGYLRSKYFPHHLNILIGKDSQFFYAMDFTTLRRKGQMSPAQRLYRRFLDNLCRPDPKGVQKSMSRIAEELLYLFCNRTKPILTLYTDEHKAYTRALYQHKTVAHMMAEGLIVHSRRKSTKEPGRGNTFYAVNYMDRQFRKDIVNYLRHTMNVARNVNQLLERMAVYRLHHNFIKPYRENSPKDGLSHAKLAGCNMKWMTRLVAERFQQRPFASLLPLTPGDLGLWLRQYRTPLKWGKEYLPKYAYG